MDCTLLTVMCSYQMGIALFAVAVPVQYVTCSVPVKLAELQSERWLQRIHSTQIRIIILQDNPLPQRSATRVLHSASWNIPAPYKSVSCIHSPSQTAVSTFALLWCDAELSPPATAGVKNARSFTSTSGHLWWRICAAVLVTWVCWQPLNGSARCVWNPQSVSSEGLSSPFRSLWGTFVTFLGSLTKNCNTCLTWIRALHVLMTHKVPSTMHSSVHWQHRAPRLRRCLILTDSYLCCSVSASALSVLEN
jgi:hypothetical protein